jgi:AraC family transcriptional regulator of adaptative response/methylated-DNA-[protein]-cysteine methyltransferase
MNPAVAGHLRYFNGTGELHLRAASYGPGGAGARIALTVAPSEFGVILLGATAHGLCWVGIHESTTYLESELRRDLPHAGIIHDDGGMRDVAAKVLGFIGTSRAPLDLPVDIRATPFQLAVWCELCAIPPGATRSYGEIARRIGQPGSARAVGHANGSNPLAIVIPCHRALGAGGKLTGYRWGLEYKRRLLEHERLMDCRGGP